MGFEFSPLSGFQALPVVFLWNANLPIIILAVFIGHFQKQQIGELFQVIAVAHPIIPQGVAETSDFCDNACCVVHLCFFSLLE